MANYKKYAENLIGNWERDIYEPQKDVTRAIYNTNWDRLTNDFNAVKEKLARNFELARNEYNNVLSNVQDTSFDRMQNAYTDLANRGLSSSGMQDLTVQADTQAKGQQVDEALASLLAQNNATANSLAEGVMNLGEEQTKLAGNLAQDIGKLTDADAANAQQYANLLGGIGESAAQRAAARAAARASSGASKKDDERKKKADEMERKRLIANALMSNELTDDEKAAYLNIELNVPSQAALDAVKVYNNNKLLDETLPKIENLENKLNSYNNDAVTKVANATNKVAGFVQDYGGLLKPLGYAAEVFNPYNAYDYWRNKSTKSSLDTQKKLIEGLSYKDLYDTLYK